MILNLALIGFAVLIGLAAIGTLVDLGRSKFPQRQPRMKVKRIDHGGTQTIGDGAWTATQAKYPRGKYSKQASARVRDIEPRGM